mmetsp:Transcript_15473/g.13512  ORF Transcript_15473/g.13512 Transcript_15473/m.13512 type:complete len:87 (-) Transcript_15473:794-1054(-)|eukprot:CAMPEP_0205810294 /NCGR_PEP_ID=MMETSP0205-20121125/14469_1 /ASSEMBLY_ACC=CAM_ASM_000278 /TAXON_ID=36767 /ORGANISM="Euplotes focardii, Strain TN1" /LENGTH=86 /DNA_ID=CAMNT_0053088271 /DNA_START=371 /DNA_END=631 /DNA_ORIENTATION=+
MSLSLMNKNDDTYDINEFEGEEQKLTMSMLIKEQPNSQYLSEEPPQKSSTYNKLQKDLNNLQAKIKGLENKLKPKSKKNRMEESGE